ncbi:MAG TPA: DUF4142 domain-containing protein [Arenibaculum sp.]|nr:DUF4142 domain-containing protein [Arenibaculum sp.]
MQAKYAMAAAIAAMLALPAMGAAQQTSGAATAQQGTLSEQDQAFVTNAASSNQFEILSSEMMLEALGDSQDNQDIRQFAERMVSDHTTVGQELESIAQAKGLTVEPDLNASHRSMMEELNTYPADQRAPTYIHYQVVAHQDAMNLFGLQVNEGQDPELRSFAQQTLPALEQHLEMAQAIQSDMNVAETSAGGIAGGSERALECAPGTNDPDCIDLGRTNDDD